MLEGTVADALSQHLTKNLHHALTATVTNASQAHALSKAIEGLAASPPDQRLQVIGSVLVKPGEMSMTLCGDALGEALAVNTEHLLEYALTFTAPCTLRRRGVETKLVLGQRKPEPDSRLQRTLARAIASLNELKAGLPIKTLAAREKISPRFLRSRLQMAFLSPAIMKAIIEGTHPVHLSTHSFAKIDIPSDWDEQARVFGFTSQ